MINEQQIMSNDHDHDHDNDNGDDNLRELGSYPRQSFGRGVQGSEATGASGLDTAIGRPKASTKPSKFTRVSGFSASLGRARFGFPRRRVLVSFENCMFF